MNTDKSIKAQIKNTLPESLLYKQLQKNTEEFAILQLNFMATITFESNHSIDKAIFVECKVSCYESQ